MKRLTLCAFAVLAFCLGFLPDQAKAQTVTGISAISYDPNTTLVFGYSVTELDYYACFYYDAYVEGYLYDPFGLVDAGYDWETCYAEVDTSTFASIDGEYDVVSDHYVVAYYYYEAYAYYDPFGYSFLSPGSYGGQGGFFGPGPSTYEASEFMYLGSTGVGLQIQHGPVINGPNTLWYFGGLQPQGYATQVTLTCSVANAASYQWEVTQGQDKLAFSISNNSGPITTTTNVVDVYGTGRSMNPGDVSVSVIVNGANSGPFDMTVLAPTSLRARPNVDNVDAVYNYISLIRYAVIDQFGNDLPAATSVNETWTSGVVSDFAGTNWRRIDPIGFASATSRFADEVQGESNAGAGIPPAIVPQNPLGNTPVHHWGQAWFVGDTTPGDGLRVQTDNLQKYTDHARHTNIVTPAP